MSYQEQTTVDQTVTPIRDEKLATHDVFETAAANADLTSFVDRLKQAALEEILRGPDLFTVLAPVNDVVNQRGLTADSIRDYVLRGAATADELKRSRSIKTIDGKALEITSSEDGIRIAGARIVRADIECTNGVIQVIDSLLNPSATQR